MRDGPGRHSADPTVTVNVESLNLFDLSDERPQRILRQPELVFEGLDAILNRVGFTFLAVHQAGLYNFPENAHLYPRFNHSGFNLTDVDAIGRCLPAAATIRL